MTLFQIKEANRYYWIVKGRLIPDGWSEKDIMAIYLYTSLTSLVYGVIMKLLLIKLDLNMLG